MKILRVLDIYNLSVANFMLKYTQGKVGKVFENYFTPITAVHNYPTRQASIFRPPLCKSQISARFITNTGIDIWSNFIKRHPDKTNCKKISKFVIEDITNDYE